MTKLYGFLWQTCASAALTLAVVALLAAGQGALADEPPTPPPPSTTDSCTSSEHVNSTTGVMTCSFAGVCIINGVDKGCNNTTTRNSEGEVIACSTDCF